MSPETQAVLLNAVPLLVLAGVYLSVAGALAPLLWRDRRRTGVVDVAVAAVFPAVAVCALVLGGLVLHDGRPLGDHAVLSLAAILVALVPALAVLARWRERELMLGGGARARAAEARVSERDRELEAVAAISNRLVRAEDELSAARIVADEVARLVGVEFAAIALVDQPAGRASGLVARRDGADLDWWAETTVDLREPSGIASAVFEGAPVAVYDATVSSQVSRRLAERVGAKSGAWIPMIAEGRVLGVLVLASVAEHHAFVGEELDVLQGIASEAALAIDRTESAAALREALARERLVSEISRKVRSELDVDTLMRVAVEETARGLGAARCFIRLGEPGGPTPVVAEWDAEGVVSVGDSAPLLPISNLALAERRTVAVDDVRSAPEAEPNREELLERLGSRSVAASPLQVFEQVIGVLAIHHTLEHRWTAAEVALVEAVARELALALHTAGLLAENARRLEQQSALLQAAQVLTGELELELVLERLVAEVAGLLDADAADCYLVDAGRGGLRCAAVHGLPTELIGSAVDIDEGLAGIAIRQGRPVRSEDYPESTPPAPSPLYEGFAGAVVAPIAWAGETRGVLGVGRRDPERRFDEADADVLGTLASLAALALRNAESYEERARQARIQRGFYRIAEVLGEPLSLGETVAAAAQAACQALGGDRAAVLMPSAGGMTLAGAHELPDAVAAVLGDGEPAAVQALLSAAAERRVLASSRLADDDRFEEAFRALATAAGHCSLLAIPIEAPRADAPALAVVLFDRPHVFSDDDLDLARQVARATSGALERAELYEAERSSRALAQQLARTGALLATELDPAAVIAEVTEQAPALLELEACSIRSLEGDELVVSAVSGEGLEELVGHRGPTTSWPAGDVVQSRTPVTIADAAAGRRAVDGEPVLAAGFASYLGVPLFGREGSLHGVLAVYARRPRAWREEEAEALSALAANASVALSNAELYQRVALEREQSVAILANIADGIVAVDRDGRIVLWNQSAAQITGVPRDEAIGRMPAQVLHRELESDGTGTGGARLVPITRGGEEIWLSLSEAVMRDPVGAVAGRIFAFRDISSERIVEQMKSDFVSTVSHELRTPLTSIYGFAETLLRRDVDFGDEERQLFLGYIASESERLTSIVDALLNVARLDTGDLQVTIAPTDVGQVVEEVVSGVRSAAEADGHRFVVELAGTRLTADADAEKLRQIVDQLVQNAVKFSPEGGTVRVVARRRPDAVQVSVVDEGIGISALDQQRIFSKFFRAEAAGRAGGGAGLGLFIAHGLVSAMGGRIWVDSTEGSGSAFTFELPVAEPELAAVAEEGE